MKVIKSGVKQNSLAVHVWCKYKRNGMFIKVTYNCRPEMMAKRQDK